MAELETEAISDTTQPIATRRELLGWYLFSFASEPISAAAISGFFPLLVQEAALLASGFPGVCPNIVPTRISSLVFPGQRNATAFLYNGVEAAFLPSSSCTPYNGSVYCPGLPSNADECLEASGRAGSLYPLRTPSVGGVSWNPTAYVTALLSIATLLQLFLFTSLGSLADYGHMRIRILGGLTCFCILFSTLTLTLESSQYQSAGCLFVLLTVCYGATFVQYNGFLPFLAAADPETLRAAPRERATVRVRRMNAISSHGYGWGYVGAIVVLLASVGITLSSSSAIGAYRGSVGLSGFWFLVFGWFPFVWMRSRPGPPLPPHSSKHCSLPWGEVLTTVQQYKKLPNTFLLLSCWFFYADGVNLIGNIGAQYANAYVDWRPLPKGLGLASMLLLVPVFAAAGNFFWPWVEQRYKLQTWHIVVREREAPLLWDLPLLPSPVRPSRIFTLRFHCPTPTLTNPFFYSQSYHYS